MVAEEACRVKHSARSATRAVSRRSGATPTSPPTSTARTAGAVHSTVQYSTVQHSTVQYLYRCAAWGPMAAQVGGHRNLPQYNEEALKSALYHHVGTQCSLHVPALPPLHLSPRWPFLIQTFCEAQGKGRARGRPKNVTQRSFIYYRWWMVDGGLVDILSLMLYTKFG